jgi:hypothetical protein
MNYVLIKESYHCCEVVYINNIVINQYGIKRDRILQKFIDYSIEFFIQVTTSLVATFLQK